MAFDMPQGFIETVNKYRETDFAVKHYCTRLFFLCGSSLKTCRKLLICANWKSLQGYIRAVGVPKNSG